MTRWLLVLAMSGLAARAETNVIRSGLVLPRTERGRRSLFHKDPVEAKIVRGEWAAPSAGDELKVGDSNLVWRAATAGEDGVFTNAELEGGYLDCAVESDAEKVELLRPAGQEVVYVNGEPRPGDPYSNGILELPVKLRRGTNDFLFKVDRGRLKASLVDPPRPVMLYLGDRTVPDIVHGQMEPQWAAVVVVNCTTKFLEHWSLEASVGGRRAMENELPPIPPMSSRKVGFQFRPAWNGRTNVLTLEMRLRSPGKEADDSATLNLQLKRETGHYNQTFRSDLDGSVQYFAVAPAQPMPGEAAKALFLSTHGASVEASNQAAAYQSKTWGTVAAPTNRRPYGFDWEDWGEHDALEVLNLAMVKFGIDPHEVYLTGHSMGGHGAWHLGVTHPDLFAAVAPSAGWISFWSYGGADRKTNADAMEAMLQRANNPGDTLGAVSNCLHFGVYILHGAEDDNVPVTEARAMRDRLSQFDHDFMYHEQPGAGHWWGNQCVDWPPLFDLLARHRIPDDDAVSDINFTTMNPGLSASSHWISIWQQERALERSSVIAHHDPIGHRFEIATTNVARLLLEAGKIEREPAVVTLDGQDMGKLQGEALWFARQDGHWSLSTRPAPEQKGPYRYGPFKEAFGHRIIFVYATHGSAEENAWAAAKCRFDAESWWYRGNGSVDIMADSEFDPTKEVNRGVMLYGNTDNNSAWGPLLGNSPVQAREGSVTIGSHSYQGNDLACLFCRPRPGSAVASVAVVSGTGIVGLRLTTRAPLFIAGAALPDCVIYGPETLEKGAEGARAAGFFGMDWEVETGDFVWR